MELLASPVARFKESDADLSIYEMVQEVAGKAAARFSYRFIEDDLLGAFEIHGKLATFCFRHSLHFHIADCLITLLFFR